MSAIWRYFATAILTLSSKTGVFAQTPAANVLDTALLETVENMPVRLQLSSGEWFSRSIVVTHFRPKETGSFPAVVLLHGRTSDARDARDRIRLIAQTKYWVERGFAVFVPTRVGYGASGTEIDPESSGTSCNGREYRSGVLAAREQAISTISFAKAKPWVQSDRFLIVGISYGGVAAIAAGNLANTGIVGIVNFAGGSGGSAVSRPGRPCSPERLRELYAELSLGPTLPSLWLYSENDQYWGSSWPRAWHAAYATGSKGAEFHMFPPLGDDGHRIASNGGRLWRPIVDDFIRRLDFSSRSAGSAAGP